MAKSKTEETKFAALLQRTLNRMAREMNVLAGRSRRLRAWQLTTQKAHIELLTVARNTEIRIAAGSAEAI